jgi:hypothetical protein
MQRLQSTILIFAVLFAAFLILPALLNAPFPIMPLLAVADVFDLATPWILLPIYFLMLHWGGPDSPSFPEQIIFVLFAALWAQGQGMHLGANSIGHLLKDLPQTEAYALTHFYDEVLSHYLWNIGILGLAGLLLKRQWRAPFPRTNGAITLEIVAAIIYGITTFITTIEAGVVPLTLPFSLIVAGFFLWRGRTQAQVQPLLTFFGVAYLISAVLIVGWGIYWRGFPQFSEIGIIS